MKALAALLVTSLFAVSATPAMTPAPREIVPVQEAIAAAVATPATAAVLKARARRGCKCWGELLDIRRIEASTTAPASFEFTVRMYDGSLHTTPSTTLGSWRVGDRIYVASGKQT